LPDLPAQREPRSGRSNSTGCGSQRYPVSHSRIPDLLEVSDANSNAAITVRATIGMA